MLPPEASLVPLGWDDRLAALAAEQDRADATPGRVARVDRGRATVLTADGPMRVESGSAGPVATGDWVLVETDVGDPRIVAVFERSSQFVRGDPMDGRARDAQIVAANIDTVLVVQSLTTGPNLRRLERELVLVYESRATPVVVLTKADLVDDVEAAVERVGTVAPGVDVVVTSSVTGEGVEALRAQARSRTVALIGASGVGKSTLVNLLVGDDVQATAVVRARDQRGRHTTTARELVLLPEGGVLIDTPGLRAVALWDADEGLSRVFGDIEELALKCRFADCAHVTEPGCAVRAAVERGELDPARVAHFQRLDRELDAAARRRDERIANRAMRSMPKRP